MEDEATTIIIDLVDLLRQEKSIDTVDLRSSEFTTTAIRTVLLPLLTNSSVRSLYLPIDRVDLICAKTLVIMIQNNIGPPIEDLYLSNMPLEGVSDSSELCKHSSMIISSMKHNTRIKKFHIAPENALHHSVISSITATLHETKVISALTLRGCGISHIGATKLSCALANNASIIVLDLSNNPLYDGGVCSVALAIEMNQTIKKLKLSGTNMGAQGGEAIAAALAINTSLEVLDMSRNALDDHVITKLSRSLKCNSSLKQLSLKSNAFSDIGALCLSLAMYDSIDLQTVLGCNHTIRYLNINSNQLSRKCIMHTDNALRRNAFSSSVNEATRAKVSSFLIESEPNCLFLRKHFGTAETSLHLMPYLLCSMNNCATVMYHLIKNLIVNTLTTTHTEISAERSLTDSVFSFDNNCNGDTKHDRVPATVHLNFNE